MPGAGAGVPKPGGVCIPGCAAGTLCWPAAPAGPPGNACALGSPQVGQNSEFAGSDTPHRGQGIIISRLTSSGACRAHAREQSSKQRTSHSIFSSGHRSSTSLPERFAHTTRPQSSEQALSSPVSARKGKLAITQFTISSRARCRIIDSSGEAATPRPALWRGPVQQHDSEHGEDTVSERTMACAC